MKFSFEEGNTPLRHQGIIKEGNIKQLFDLILAQKGISRIEISGKTGLSRSTVSFLIDELLKVGIVNIMGKGNSDSSGRKPIMLTINQERTQVIAISLREKKFFYKLFGLGCDEIESFSRDIIYEKGFGKKIKEYILNRSLNLRQDVLLAVCVSIPAQINSTDNSIILSILDIKRGCNLIQELKSMWPDIPLTVGNQSSALAYAEYKNNFTHEVEDMIFFNLNEGVAAGIFFNGRVFTAEIGHMSIDTKGPPCECGKNGCLELFVSRDAIMKRFNAAAGKRKKRIKLTNYKAIKKRLEEGDKPILKTAKSIASEVALGINNVICMFNPKSIIIGGGIEELGAVFLNMAIREIKIPDVGGIEPGNHFTIDYSHLGSDADLRGVVQYFFDKIFTITMEMGNTVYIWN